MTFFPPTPPLESAASKYLLENQPFVMSQKDPELSPVSDSTLSQVFDHLTCFVEEPTEHQFYTKKNKQNFTVCCKQRAK